MKLLPESPRKLASSRLNLLRLVVKRNFFALQALLVVCYSFGFETIAQEASPEKTGLAIGQKAPAFTLKDQNDKEVSLASLLKKGPVALVFYRSADW